MSTGGKNASQRLREAAPSLATLVGPGASLGEIVPPVAMPMHLSLDGVSARVFGRDGECLGFVKAHHEGALAPFHFADGVEAATRAAQLGLAPQLVHADQATATLLFEAAPEGWRMAFARDLRDSPDLMRSLVAAKKRLHGAPLLSRTLSPFDVANDYTQRLDALLSGSVLPFPYKGGMPFQAMAQWIERIGEMLRSAGHDVAPVHGENVISNVLIGPDHGILLVDFDRSVNADPHLDLGALGLELCGDDIERMAVVEAYSGRSDTAVLARMKLYGLVDDFLWGCWALLAEANPVMAGPELFKYAGNRFVRLSYHLQTFDLAAIFRRL